MGRTLTSDEMNPQPLLGAFREEVKTTIRKPERENWVLKPFVLKEHKKKRGKEEALMGPGRYNWTESGHHKSVTNQMRAHDEVNGLLHKP